MSVFPRRLADENIRQFPHIVRHASIIQQTTVLENVALSKLKQYFDLICRPHIEFPDGGHSIWSSASGRWYDSVMNQVLPAHYTSLLLNYIFQ